MASGELEGFEGLLSDKQVGVRAHLSALLAEGAAGSVAQLRSQLEEVQEPTLQSHFAASLAATSSHAASLSLQPFPTVVSRETDPRVAAWESVGLREIAQGRVAMVVLAGGQGTRLGSSLPKGLYDIGLPSGKSLFQLQAEKILAIKSLARKSDQTVLHQASLPYYVLTSEATEQATREYFASHGFFGLPEPDVVFIEQASCPCLSADGQLLLESPSGLCLSPNGNGGVYEALARSGALADMRARGVASVMVAGIDNGLLRIADPPLVGMLVQERLEAALKVVPKAHPDERVGVLGLIGGQPGIVEYSEIDPLVSRSVDASTGELVFNAGNICIHAFSLDFLDACGARHYPLMPYHLAFKAVPHWDPVQKEAVLTPQQPNAYKLEKFVFDVLPFCASLVAMQVCRDQEFAPVKNAPGSPTDTPLTSRALISRLHRSWLLSSGAFIEGDPDALVEISPLVSLQGEGLESVRGRTFHAPLYLHTL